MEVDEVAAGKTSTDGVVTHSKNPLEKMRVRLAADNYSNNKPNQYKSIPDDSDDDRTAGLLSSTFYYSPSAIKVL